MFQLCLPRSPRTQQVIRELRVIPFSLLVPQALHKDLCSGCVGCNVTEWILLAGKYFVYVPHCDFRALNHAMPVGQGVRLAVQTEGLLLVIRPPVAEP